MRHLHNSGEANSWLIGDSGYPLQPFLMTPVGNAEPFTPKAAYNQAHMSSRNVVERTIGLLKMRFRCILKERVARYAPDFVAKLVTSCAVLHNMCVDAEVPLIENNDLLGEEELDLIRNVPPVWLDANLLNEGRRVRNNIVNRYFMN